MSSELFSYLQSQHMNAKTCQIGLPWNKANFFCCVEKTPQINPFLVGKWETTKSEKHKLYTGWSSKLIFLRSKSGL